MSQKTVDKIKIIFNSLVLLFLLASQFFGFGFGFKLQKAQATCGYTYSVTSFDGRNSSGITVSTANAADTITFKGTAKRSGLYSADCAGNAIEIKFELNEQSGYTELDRSDPLTFDSNESATFSQSYALSSLQSELATTNLLQMRMEIVLANLTGDVSQAKKLCLADYYNRRRLFLGLFRNEHFF